MFVLGVMLAHLAFWLDHVDGQVARWRRTASLDGVYLDYLMHHSANLTLGFALGYGLAARSGDARWSIAGFIIGAGWTMLGLHNDCRYKAFFQRLKAASGTYYGSEEDRAGGPSRPIRGRDADSPRLTWPAYKACEPHVVLLGLTAMAVLAVGFPVGLASILADGGDRLRDRHSVAGWMHVSLDRWARGGRAGIRSLVQPRRCVHRCLTAISDLPDTPLAGQPLDILPTALYQRIRTIVASLICRTGSGMDRLQCIPPKSLR